LLEASVDTSTAERVVRVRAFNRFYTKALGFLGDDYLHTQWNVSEARVIYELATRDGSDAATLRKDLGLDSGYLSRILARLEADGLVERGRSSADRRRQTVALTTAGRKVFRQLDRRSAQDVGRLLSLHSERNQRRLLAAIETITDVLNPDGTKSAVELRSAQPGEYGWVVARHGAIYATEFGWNVEFEALVARIVADFLDRHDPSREAVWIAVVGGEPVGSVFCVRRDAKTAQLRLLLVEPAARSLGVGTRLVDACVAFAHSKEYERLVLWTNDVLVDARRIYERAGFRLKAEEPHHSFGVDLVGQNWSLDLRESG
jgi:DNA-binding MarR family transcriptional regulator/GNAT superfamily N-acetyltransferase